MRDLFRRIRPAGRETPSAPGPKRAGKDGARHLLHLLGEGGAPDAAPPPEDELRRIAAELVRRIEGGQAAPRRGGGTATDASAPRSATREAAAGTTSGPRSEETAPIAKGGATPEPPAAFDPGAGWRAAMRAAPKGRSASVAAPDGAESARTAQPPEQGRAEVEPEAEQLDPATAPTSGWAARLSAGSGSLGNPFEEADGAGPVFRSRLAVRAEAPAAPRAGEEADAGIRTAAAATAAASSAQPRPVPPFDPKRAVRPPATPVSVADLLVEAEAAGTLAAEHPATIVMALRDRSRPEQAAALRRLPPTLARSVHRMLLR
ncbi:hypothetical protein [Jannaschia sp. W003]|uniref:hypothetical protein n=1 Tax=Jannaschia sp. W003 TaxID=2867012 RepID=UPI0021A7BAAE|nr:hypothetical protein [Jannaschia sp. W003]UWQ21817.1 hypothetical protein K3554_01955 [Jannaschia sp. W003]